jgi:adenosine deaminase
MKPDPVAPEVSRPPLVELHLHLEGALTATRAVALARAVPGLDPPPRGGIRTASGAVVEMDPDGPIPEDARWFFFDLGGFLRLFGWASRLLTTPAAYRVLLEDLLEALERQGVVYAEVFVAIGQMLHVEVDPGDILPDLAAIAEARASAGGPDVRFIADATRQWGVRACDRVLDQALRLQAYRVVGFGMGGDEAGPRARDFKSTYRRAARAGLGLTCHAGEGTHADAVREVVEELGVRRVGHGIASATDETLLRELREERVLLEVCPTSNLCTGAWRPEEGRHPFFKLAEHEVPMALGSDDPAYFQTSLPQEWSRLEAWGCETSLLEGLNREALAWTFASEDDRMRLQERIAAAT